VEEYDSVRMVFAWLFERTKSFYIIELLVK